MSTTVIPTTLPRSRTIQAKHILFIVFGLMTAFVLVQREMTLLDGKSFLRQRYASVPWLMVLHGIPGALALGLGVLQFSTRLRQKYLQVHKVMGRLYVGSVALAAPAAVIIASVLVTPTLLMASVIQSLGWALTTGTALYCVRTGQIQQHKEWMMRSYPFAMVFVVVRTLQAIPVIQRMGLVGLQTTVWSVIATACFLPSFIIAWQQLKRSKPAVSVRVRAASATAQS